MSLLLLFAGAGPQAPAPPATGPICGTVSFNSRPLGSTTRTKNIGYVDSSVLDKFLTITTRPIGSTRPSTKPSGSVTPSPVGTVSIGTRPSGIVTSQARANGEVTMCED